MTRIVRFFALTASVGTVALVLSFTSAGPAMAQTFKPAMSLIINDAAHPVPVILNGAAHPVPVVNVGAAPEPFQWAVSSFSPSTTSIRVPDGKRLVIEFYSGSAATLAPCTTAAMTISTHATLESSSLGTHSLLAVPIALQEPSDFNQYTISQQVRLYAAPGSLVTVSTYAGCHVDFTGVISGHLLDAP